MNTIENNLKEGETLFADGRIDEAEECFKSILQNDPQNVKALNNLGVIYIQNKDYKTGVETLLKALENNPEDDDVNMNLQSLINNELVQNELKDNLNNIFKKKKLKAIERNVALRLAKTVGYSTPYKVAHLCIDITPNNLSKENPVYLQGFSGKPRVADTAITPLFMKMLLIEDRSYNKTLIVSADIFGFNDIIVEEVKEIVQPWGIPPEAIILNASHNHYAPGTIDNLPQSLGPYYEQYARGIIQNIAQNMDKLYEGLESCLIYNGKVDGKIGVNRRLKKDGKIDFGVNPEGYYESHTPFLFIQLLNTSQNLLLVNHGCHPTGLNDAAIIFADFPVYLSELLKQEAFISEVMFLQGAAGSTKEAHQAEGTIAFTNTPEQVALNGKILADQILGQLKEELEYVEGTIFAKKIIAYLPYQQIPSNGEIKLLAEDKKTPNLIKEWANILLENDEILNTSNLPVTISLVSLSKDLCFIALNGEPVAELGRLVLKQFSNKDSTFLLGYTNGLKAYLPTREQITEGGYESDLARYVYNLPAPFDESVEERIKDCIKSLIESWQERDKPNGFGRYYTRKGGSKAFFSLSSGRCGTQTLADILDTTSNARVYHHPRPYLVNEALKAYQDDIDKSKTFWRARKGVINDAWKDSLIFGELDHNMTPFATTICKEIPDSKFIILIRNPWGYVRSGMRRNYYSGHPWDSGRLCPEVHHQDYERWQKMDQFEKVCWLWNETYLRISKSLEQIPSDNYIVVKFEDLIANAEKSREIFKFLNLKKFRKNVIDSILSKKTNKQTSGAFPKPEEWTFQQHQTLIKECGETIKKYGYESYKEKYVDNKIQIGKTTTKTRDQEKQSILFIEQKGLSTGGHLDHIVDNLQEKYNVRYLKTQDLTEVIDAVKCADIVWLEWASQLTALVTQKIRELESKPVICRLHGFEVFTELPQQINWNIIDKLIFVANHKQEIFNKRFPHAQVDQTVIRNGVVTNKFSIPENKVNTKKLLLLGHINYRKGLTLLIQFYNELLKQDPEFHLYIRGDWQDLRYKMAIMTMVHELKLYDKITFVEGWIDDLNAWISDKSHILSFSLEESFHYTIGNGMAAGLKPVIHAWNESREIWPNEFIFNDVQTFLDIMLDKTYEPERYRTLLFKNRLTSSAQTANIETLIDELVNGSPHFSDRVIPQNGTKIQNTINILKPLTPDKTTQQAKEIYKKDFYSTNKHFIVTGIPRSGTSLFSTLTNKLKNCVCLNEIAYDVPNLPHLFARIREDIINGKPIPNKYGKEGELVTDTHGVEVKVLSKILKDTDKNAVIGSKVNMPYLQQIQTILDFGYKVIAFVRDPAFTIASWSSEKAGSILENKVTRDNMSPRWADIKFTTEDKYGRQSEIWQQYASLIWSLRDKIKIVRYEDLTEKTHQVMQEICQYLGLENTITEDLTNMNIASRFKHLEEVRQRVMKYCHIRKEFGYFYQEEKGTTLQNTSTQLFPNSNKADFSMRENPGFLISKDITQRSEIFKKHSSAPYANKISSPILSKHNLIIDKVVKFEPLNRIKSCCDLSVDRLDFDKARYEQWVLSFFPEWQRRYGHILNKKIIELFVTYQILDLQEEDEYMDAAGGINTYADRIKCKKRYLQGISVSSELKSAIGNEIDYIQGDAAKIDLPDECLTKISSHHSFEHFQGNSDSDFIKEVQRLLKVGGKCCIIPIFIADKYVEVSRSNKHQYHYDANSTYIIDSTARITGGATCGDYARIYDISSFNKRVIDQIDREKFNISLSEVTIDGNSVPDFNLQCHEGITRINYPYRVLTIERIR